MEQISTANSTVMTLDAGGTNFVFSAIQGGEEVVSTLSLPSCANDLNVCLKNIIRGFEQVRAQLSQEPVAISFAFPGPADYANGIIGDLGNLPAFRGGVALGPMLENHFNIPVFINNDGDLFAYGEAKYGLLPAINKKLALTGSLKQYRNLIGLTLGTGFGGGIVFGNELLTGENGAAGEVWLLRNPIYSNFFAEESISARAIVREYAQMAGDEECSLSPLDIYKIAKGEHTGNTQAALDAFVKFGSALGASLTQIITLFDAPVVLGGGLADAWDLFAPQLFRELAATYSGFGETSVDRLVMQTYNLQDEQGSQSFLQREEQKVNVPFSDKTISYDPVKRIGIGLSKLGTSKAISLGAYAFAISALNSK